MTPVTGVRLLSTVCALAGVAAACGSSRTSEPAALGPGDAGPDATDAPSARPLCVDGESVDGAYPKAEYGFELGRTLPDLSFDAERGKVSLRDFFEPCAERSRLLVLRVTASWCGTCAWDLAHTKELLASDVAGRVRLLDVLVANEDNVPARVADLPAFRKSIDAETLVAIDPAFRLGPSRIGRASLPLYVLVDTRRMEVRLALDAPEPEELVDRLRGELSLLDGGEDTKPSIVPTTDGFTRKQWDLLRAMKLPGAPPPDPTNAKADDPAAAALGATLFADASLSPSGTVSCATCHDPKKGFADGRPRSVGVAEGDRNAPSVLFAAHARWQFWDGRADTLWAQAAGPFENEKEFASSRLFVAHAIHDRHQASYEAVFGPLPPLSDASRFPASGKPGDASWASMSEADRAAVTRVLVNVAKAIAAFERTLRAKPNAFDRYLDGDTGALTAEQKVSLGTFFSAGCVQCHHGPRLTDDAFHALRFPTGRLDGKPDEGRKLGIAALLASELRADGPFSDAPSAAHGLAGLEAGAWTHGAFKTPPLRGLPATAPYGHGGTLATLTDVSEVYSTAGLKPDDPRAVGESEPWVTEFAEWHVPEVPPFLEVLTAEPN